MMIKDIPKDCDQLSISRCCSDLHVSRSGFYAWMKQDQISAPDNLKMKIKSEIENIVLDFPRYGYRRVKIELHRRGSEVNHKVVYDIMKENDLLCSKNQFVPRTTDSEHNLPFISQFDKGYVCHKNQSVLGS